jgi:hypothetical protein
MLDAQLERDADLNSSSTRSWPCCPSSLPGPWHESAGRGDQRLPVAAVERGQAPERRGYLRRQADPDDGRCTQAVLTDAGMAKVMETAPGHVAAARQVVIDAVTPAQLRRLRAANDRILAGSTPRRRPGRRLNCD